VDRQQFQYCLDQEMLTGIPSCDSGLSLTCVAVLYSVLHWLDDVALVQGSPDAVAHGIQCVDGYSGPKSNGQRLVFQD